MTNPGVQIVPDALPEEPDCQVVSRPPTAREEHVGELIAHLREKRQSLRAQLEQLEGVEQRKTVLEEKIQHVEADLTALGYVDPPPPEMLVEAEAQVPPLVYDPAEAEASRLANIQRYNEAVAASKAAVEASWREHRTKQMQQQAEALRAKQTRAAQAAGTDEPAEHTSA